LDACEASHNTPYAGSLADDRAGDNIWLGVETCSVGRRTRIEDAGKELEGALANRTPGHVKGVMHEKMAKPSSEK
jgi:hypothetical protein